MITDLNSKTRFRPVIRVFVSSTFSDMKHERNALQEHVFLKLEELCQKNGFQFQAIDLRWGVSSEAGLDHRTMRICFDELRRAQEISPEPNFLVLLGDRYGWRPLPEEISQGEFEMLMSCAKGENHNHNEIRGVHGKSSCQILEEWYRCDENILLSDTLNNIADYETLNYILQPRTQSLADGRDHTKRKDDPTRDTQDWIDVQQVLWQIINSAFPTELMTHRFHMEWNQHIAEVNAPKHPKRAIPQIARFQASATEQEIWCGALSALNTENHVIACYREITNRDIFDTSELGDFYNLNESGEFDSFSSTCQSDLKAVICHRLGKNVPISIPFNQLKREHDKLAIEATEITTKKFCDDVFNSFKPIIERQIEEYWEKSKPSSTERAARELKIERNEHKRFGTERGGEKSFVGRELELQAIRDYLKTNSPWPLVIHGTSGCGKTALLARAFEEIPENQKPIIRFIGTTPYSSDIRSLLYSLCQELRERFPRADTLPSDTTTLQDEFDLQLRAVKQEQPLILFLDALDQLSDTENGRLLNWIPYGQLPPNVKLVISCLSDRPKDDLAGQPFAELKRRQLTEKNSIDLDALSKAEAGILLFRNWLPQAGRKVSDLQRECIGNILESKDCCQPIYLKLLFEEARLWHSYDVPEIGKDLSLLLHQLFGRLSQETNHGHLLIERVLSYLNASRYGLAENEILEILFADLEYKAKLNKDNQENRHELPLCAKRIPIAIWSRLCFDLAPYLTERAAPGANVLTFYHRQVAEWVQEHFSEVANLELLSANTVHIARHQQLAAYFYAQDYFLESLEEQQARAKRLPPTTRPANIRKVDEMPWQRLCEAKLSEEWAEIEKLFTNLFFLEAKVEAGLVFDLAFDFAQTLRAMPVERPRRWYILLLGEALRRDIHFIDHHPTTLFQCMWNSGWWSDCPDAENHYKDGNSRRRQEGVTLHRLLETWRLQKELAQPGFNWIRSCRPPFIELGTGMIAAFSGHTKGLTSVGISSDGKTLASASWDNTACLWNMGSGKKLFTMIGHSGPVNCLAISPDGQTVVTASEDHTVRLWEIESGREMHVLNAHGGSVTCVCFSPDGKTIASGSKDGTVRLWVIDSLREIHVLNANGLVNCVCFSPDSKTIACACNEKQIALWSASTGSKITSLVGNWTGINATLYGEQSHFLSVNALVFHPSGRILASAAGNETGGEIKLWDISSKLEVAVLKHGHLYVRTVAFNHDGKLLASLAEDNSIRFWQVPDRIIGGRLTGIRDLGVLATEAECMSFSPSGSILATGGGNNTVELWDTQAVNKRKLFNHWDGIVCIAFSSDSSMCATGGSDCLIKVWDTVSGTQLVELAGHLADVRHIAFCFPEKKLISWGYDGTLRLWDLANGSCLDTRKGFREVPSTMPEDWPALQASGDFVDSWSKFQIFGGETFIKLAKTECPIAFFPGAFRNIFLDVHRRYIAGVGDPPYHIYILAMEGQGFTAE